MSCELAGWWFGLALGVVLGIRGLFMVVREGLRVAGWWFGLALGAVLGMRRIFIVVQKELWVWFGLALGVMSST